MTDTEAAAGQLGSAEGLDGASPDRPSEEKRFRVVAIVAAVLYSPQVLAHVTIPFAVVPLFKTMYQDMGGTLPAPTALMVGLGPWLAVILLAVDALICWGAYKLARRYWIGLLFAPILAGGFLMGPFITSLYMPMFSVVTQVQ